MPTTADAPPGQAWVKDNLAFLNKVWRFEVGKLGYRKPISDGKRGGNAKLDVYLKDVGARGVYGYCAPERRAKGRKWLASGYCVLDNDFAQAQYGAPPRDSMRVTAAHEFFHAVQFAYDYGEDPWLMEATATWMEERVADNVNDNRQYLPHGQVGKPAQSLDRFAEVGFNQYGNWAYFEYLSSRFGVPVVRSIWNQAGAFKGAGLPVLHGRGQERPGPARRLREGVPRLHRRQRRPRAHLRRGPGLDSRAGRQELGPHQGRAARVRHRQDRPPGLAQGGGPAGHGRQDSAAGSCGWWSTARPAAPPPRRPSSYAARTASRPSRSRSTARVRAGSVVPFGSRRVSSATVVLVNASTRFSCWHRTTWSCQGRARDNNQRFDLTATALASREAPLTP